MVTPAVKREAVAHLKTHLGLSERRACQIVGADRTMVRYQAQRAPDTALRVRLRDLANELRRFIGGSPGALNAMSREDQDAYFRRALDWLGERHGKENVLSAVIHRDEATPHMTVMTIPLDDRGRLNARALVGDRGKLSAMQTDFAEQVGQPHGLERGVQGSKATHERVKSAYAHLNDPEHAVELPERRPGNFLGRGKETDTQWRQRASEAATGALVGAWSARRREQREHEVKIVSLERQTIGTPAMKHQLETLEREKRVLSRTLDLRTDEVHRLQRDLRHQEIALDVAWEYAMRLGKRQGIEEQPLNEIIEKSIKEAIRMDDAEIASASKARAAQKIRATPAPTSLHKPSSLHTPQPKAPKMVSVDHERQEETTMQQWTKAKDEGWDDGHG